MTALIILAITIWAISALTKASKERARERQRAKQIQQIRIEQARRKAEQERFKEEYRQRLLEAKLETDRLIALEREQIRQQKEQERLAREQAKQAEQLARHEERIAKLEQQIVLAEREIAHYQPIVEELRKQAEELDYKVRYYESKGLLCGGTKKELERVNEKLYQTESKIIKAQFSKSTAQQKLTA